MATGFLRRKYPEDAKKAGLGSIAEEKAQMMKLEPAKELNGTSWYCIGGAAARSTFGVGGPEGSRLKTISFTEGEAAWRYLPRISRRPGSGQYTLDTSKDPACLELHVGEKTYKGIYTVAKGQDGFVHLNLQLSAAGGAYPNLGVCDPCMSRPS